MGRSRGGLTSKLHALVDAEGRPVTLRLTAGLGEGDILLADKGDDSNTIRAKAAERKAWANIPPKANRKVNLRLFALGLSAEGPCGEAL